MLDQRLVFLGALLSILGSARYSLQTIRGHTRPNRVTWFLWAAAPIIGFVAQLGGGVGLTSIMTLSIGLGPLMIFVASFVNPASYWRIGAVDVACGCVAVLALVVWLSLDNPALAVVFAVLADLVAGVPTIRKAWSTPATENPAVFVLSTVNAVITMLTIDHWDVATWAFPAYIAVLGSTLSVLVVARPGPRRREARAAAGATA